MEDFDRINEALEGRYRIEREIGAGGMATVYVARDERHDRQVALKVLKPELAAVVGAERFLAEIRTTANLQHPHILQLYDSGEADGLLYFVMPFVDGETLGDRLEREKQLPVDEAVGLARAIAAALHAAHERGVIHRDIKPANILLSHGEPVVADFGIALAIQEAGGGRLTETGLSVGTPFYMSPEQATGDRDPDVRSDIYSLGTLLYEMLTGEPPFQGTTAQAVLGKILTGSPSPPTEYRKSIPPHVEAVILKSLERLPADRFSSAAEFGDALGNPAFRHGTEAISAGLEVSHETIRRLRRNVRRFAAATVLLVGAVILLLLPGLGGPGAKNPVVEFYVQGDSTHQVMSGIPGSVALSPDGRTLAYVGTRADIGRQLFVRSLDDRAARPIPGSEGAHDVFFSPDGDWLGFSDMENELFKIRLAGGSRIPLAQLSGAMANADWGEDDGIYYGVTGEPGLMRVSAAGGAPVELIEQSDSLLGVIDPSLMPGGDVILFTGLASNRGATVQAYRMSTGEIRVLGPGMTPIYSGRQLIYGTAAGVLLAHPFDPKTLEFTGEPVQIATGVGGWLNLSRDVAVSPGGNIAYLEGGIGNSSMLVHHPPVSDQVRTGSTMSSPRVAPDGDRVLYVEAGGNAWGLYVYSLSQGTNQLLHTAPYIAGGSWSPDGASLAVASGPDLLDYDIYLLPSDGSGSPELFRDLPPNQVPTVPEFTPDGRRLLWVEVEEGGGLLASTISAGLVDGEDGEVLRIVDDGSLNSQPTLSPDGRWLAYSSERTGRPEVFVTRFPEGGPGLPIATAGGLSPAWQSKNRLIYFDGSELVAAELSYDGTVQVTSRSPVMDWAFGGQNRFPRYYDLLPDGGIINTAPSGSGNRIVVRTSLLPSN
jgi:eukaryotic-like serine/threonine-protein kinase